MYKKFHSKAFEMAKHSEFHNYLLVEEGLDILEGIYILTKVFSYTKLTQINKPIQNH